MSSSRFPGKVMQEINGEPMIFRQIERIKRATKIDGIVVATSTHESDNRLANFLTSKDIEVFRGSLDDVLSRYLEISEKLDPGVLVRLTGDCPLVMPDLIDKMVVQFHKSGVDYLSNTLKPTFPDGLDIEILKSTALKRLAGLDLTIEEREHVTIGMIRRPLDFKLENFSSGEDRSNERWTVDYPEDLEFVRSVYRAFVENELTFNMKDVLQFLTNHPNKRTSILPNRRNENLNRIDR
jgi:spore coat polysaccharide biosynthesis protein SpsF